jgi:hypothetical protein
MDQIDLLKKVSNTVTQEPVEITVNVDPTSWLHEKGQKYLPKYFPKQVIYNIYPAKMGTMLRISSLVLSIDKDLFTSGNKIAANMEAISKHAKTLCKIIALAIYNREERPPARMVNTIMEQFSPEAIFKVVLIVLQSMNLDSFMSSIIFIRGLNLLETNPQTQGSQIAPGTSSEDLLNISDLEV